MHYIGIDPGVGGGFAALSGDGVVVRVWKMPETERDILDALEGFGPLDIGGAPFAFALLERVNAGIFGHGKAGKMGVSSAFTFGKGYGRLLMALTAARIPFNEIAPVSWQTTMQCRTGGDKNVSKRRAQQLFPSLNVTHAIADALLLAECCRRLARQGALGSTATPARKDRTIDGKESSKGKAAEGQRQAAGEGQEEHEHEGRGKARAGRRQAGAR